MVENQEGKFITFEGGDGVGKSTQCRLLCNFLKKKGISVVITREPGGTEFGEKIRHLFLSSMAGKDAIEDFLLILAARRRHLSEVILPAMEKKQWVLCDRYIDSTFVYQGLIQNQSIEWISEMHRLCQALYFPHKTFVLQEGLRKILKRRQHGGNRLDTQPREVHDKIQKAYQTVGSRFNQRCILIPPHQTIAQRSILIANYTEQLFFSK